MGWNARDAAIVKHPDWVSRHPRKSSVHYNERKSRRSGAVRPSSVSGPHSPRRKPRCAQTWSGITGKCFTNISSVLRLPINYLPVASVIDFDLPIRVFRRLVFGKLIFTMQHFVKNFTTIVASTRFTHICTAPNWIVQFLSRPSRRLFWCSFQISNVFRHTSFFGTIFNWIK